MQGSSRRKLLRLVFVPVVIAFVGGVGFALRQYPRTVLLSDIRDSNCIVVEWRLRLQGGDFQNIAYELDAPCRAAFVKVLTENLRLDYSRTQATVTPMIGIYLTGGNGEFKAYYAIRYARSIETSSPMESLRTIAATGRRLSEQEVADIFSDNGLRSKWPHILPWPLCRYDYVLPSQLTNTSEAPD